MKNIRFLFHLFLTLLLVTGYSINAMQQDHIINIPGIIGEDEPEIQLVPVIPGNNNLVQIDPEQRITCEEGAQKNIRIVQQIQAAKALAAKRKTAYESAYQEAAPGPQFEQKGLYSQKPLISAVNDGQGKQQYAQAPDYQLAMHQMHGQHNNWTRAPDYNQAMQSVISRGNDGQATDTPSHTSIPSPSHNIYLPITKTSGKVKNYDQLLKIVTDEPALQKLIRDYAIPFDEFIKQCDEIKIFSIEIGYREDDRLPPQIQETVHDTDHSYLIMSVQNAQYNIHTRTIDREKYVSGHHNDNTLNPDIDSNKTIRIADKNLCLRALGPLEDCSACLGITLCGVAFIPSLIPYVDSIIYLAMSCCGSSLGCCCCHRYTYARNKITCFATPPNKTIVIASDTYQFFNCCCSKNKTTSLEIWNKDGRLQHTASKAHTDSITSLAIHTDGTIITGSLDKTAKIWKNLTDTPIILDHTIAIHKVAVHSKIIATASKHNIKLWSHDGTEKQSIAAGFRITALKICADGTIVYAINKYTAAIPHVPCNRVVHYNHITSTTIKRLTLPANINNVYAIEESADGSIIIGTKTGHLLRWNADNSTTALRHRDSAVVSITILKNGAIAVSFKDNILEFLMPDQAAEKLLDQCTLEQLAFIKQLIGRAKYPNRIVTLHENTRERELFLSLPAYIRGALQSHCPVLRLPNGYCSSIALCCKKNQ